MPHTVEDPVWITLSDGTRLAARLWRPAGPGPFPAVLEFIPYRRRDGTARRDAATYPRFAEAGIAGVRVDCRGHGDSEGFFDDEYSPRELADACEIIAWIAAQPWCNGRVGMMGISWGGFNALQVAALRPPALKAVISIASTADRFSDDIHYKGGCLLGANVSWAATMLAYASRPPDPAIVGQRWREMWIERLEAEPFLLETWLSHQRRDAYWRHGSICEDWGAIEVPVFVIAGWNDGYRNAPATIAANARAPVKAMVGPWVHKYPHIAVPAPRADFPAMATAWWKRWLADEDTGVESWPMLRAFIGEGARPGGWRVCEAGRWVGVAAWPPPAREETVLPLGGNGLLGGATPADIIVSSPQHCGTRAGEYFPLDAGPGLPGDQGPDDKLSLVWDSEPLEAPLDVLGRPRLRLRVAIDQPQGNLIARLVDLRPDGSAFLVARGVLNLCHRAGSAAPRAMPPGDFEDIELALDETGYRFGSGHRIRLALSTTYWPFVLPAARPVRATIRAGAASRLTLPLVGEAAEMPPPGTDAPNALPPWPELSPPRIARRVEEDLGSGRVRYVIEEDTGLLEVPGDGLLMRETRDEVWEIDPADPDGASGHLVLTTERRRGDWEVRTSAEVRFTCHARSWEAAAALSAFEGGQEIFVKSWRFEIGRDHI